MKKLIAALIALTMMTTMALAADFIPGAELSFDGTEAGWSEAPAEGLNKSNYSIVSQNWSKGRDMVSSVKFSEDEDALIVTLKDNYESTKAKDLDGTIKLRDRKNGTYITLTISGSVGYDQGTIDLDSDGYASLSTDVDDKTIYKVVADEGDKPYGTLTFTAGDADVTARVYEDEVYFLGYNMVPDKKVLLANADSDAEISFLNFEAKPTFNSTATISFYNVEKDSFIYELKNGKLVKANVKWNEDTSAYDLKTRTLGTYVISDEALKNASGTTTEPTEIPDNPDTGANDIVGIATALAAVALVSAAAVSLKK